MRIIRFLQMCTPKAHLWAKGPGSSRPMSKEIFDIIGENATTLEKVVARIGETCHSVQFPVSSLFPKLKSLHLMSSSSKGVVLWAALLESCGRNVEDLDLKLDNARSADWSTVLNKMRQSCTKFPKISREGPNLPLAEYKDLLCFYGEQLELCRDSALRLCTTDICNEIFSSCQTMKLRWIEHHADNICVDSFRLLAPRITEIEGHGAFLTWPRLPQQHQIVRHALSMCANLTSLVLNMEGVHNHTCTQTLRAFFERQTPHVLAMLRLAIDTCRDLDMMRIMMPSLSKLHVLRMEVQNVHCEALAEAFEASPYLKEAEVIFHGHI